MITPAQFKSRWESDVAPNDPVPGDSKLIISGPSASLDRLPETAVRFLTEAGLPKSCAPCLCFEEVAKGLPRIWEIYSPGKWQPAEKALVEPYLMVGSDGAGNPICLDDRDAKIVLLDHELLFDPKRFKKRIQFVNSGIPELSESLLIYHTLSVEKRLAGIGQIDPPAAAADTFWFSDIKADESALKPWWRFW